MKVHPVGSSIASLAAAADQIKEAALRRPDVRIYEAGPNPGGAVDANRNSETDYIMGDGRVFEDNYLCTKELFSFMPSVQDPAS